MPIHRLRRPILSIPFIRPILLMLVVLSSSVGQLNAVDDDADARMIRLSAEADAGYDTNPTLGSHQAARQIHGDPDSFGQAAAGARITVPVIPLVLSGRIDDREYAHQEALDHTLIHSAAEVPLSIHETTLAPRFYVNDNWYGDAYYSTTTHGALRWTQDWSREWSSDLTPFMEHTSYRPPFRAQDGTETGASVSVTWWLPNLSPLRSLSLEVGGSRYKARAYVNTYSEGRVEVEQAYELPWKLACEMDLSWLPTHYNEPVANGRENRRDHLFEGNVMVKRPIGAGFSAKLACMITNNQSNRPAQQYHETEVSAGLVWEFR